MYINLKNQMLGELIINNNNNNNIYIYIYTVAVHLKQINIHYT